MDRRSFLRDGGLGILGLGLSIPLGCRGRQTAQVLKPGQQELVGSHTAGGETYKPLIDETVSKLLARHSHGIQPAGFNQGADQSQTMRICFVGVENKSIEEMGDFKEQIFQNIDTRIQQSGVYQAISRRFVEAGLRETRLRPDQLFIPQNMRTFVAAMEQMGQPFDYLLYATVTSGTTVSNKDYQRDYLLTLEMVHIKTGAADKEMATLSKAYNVSAMAKIKGALSK